MIVIIVLHVIINSIFLNHRITRLNQIVLAIHWFL